MDAKNNITVILSIIAGVQLILLTFVKWRRDKDMAGIEANAKQLTSVLANVAWLTKTCERQDSELTIVRAAHEKCQEEHLKTIKEFSTMMNDAMVRVTAQLSAGMLVESARSAADKLKTEAIVAAVELKSNAITVSQIPQPSQNQSPNSNPV